jgi:tRNA (guanine37-N1)-methyltransferase
MKSPGLRVLRGDGERARVLLRESHSLRDDLRIVVEDGWVYLPLVPGVSDLPEWGMLVEREFEPAAASGPQDYRELLSDLPPVERDALPRSFDIVGDVVLLRIPPALDHRSSAIGAALLQFVPGARIVGADHGVHGAERRRSVERIAGAGGWRTRHRENGLEFEVDLERAYFSPRLAREHARVAGEIRPGARVYDLCCGVGPFAVTIAHSGRASRVVAVDMNPDAIELLRATLSRHPWGELVTPIATSLERFLEGAEPFEVAVLNLPHEGIKYLPSVGNLVAPGGRIFYYQVVARERPGEADRELLQHLAASGEWKLLDRHIVHPYSPTSDLFGFTFERAVA